MCQGTVPRTETTPTLNHTSAKFKDESISRVNYGVTFQHYTTALIPTDIFRTTFVINLPNSRDVIRHSMPPIPRSCQEGDESRRVFCNTMTSNRNVFAEMKQERQLLLIRLMDRIREAIPPMNQDFRQGRGQRLRLRRTILPSIATFSGSEYGRSSTVDLEHLVAAVQVLKERSEQEMNKVKKATTRLASVVYLEDNFVKELETRVTNLTQKQATLMQEWGESGQEVMYLSKWHTMTMEWLFHTETLCQHLQMFLTGIMMLTAGHLSPSVVSERTQKLVINQASEELQEVLGSVTVVHTDVAYYYKYGSFLYMSYDEKIVITLQIPVTQWKEPFEIYQVMRFPVFVQGHDQVTLMEDLPEVIAVEKGALRYFSMTNNELMLMQNNHFSLTRKGLMKTMANDCVMNLYRNYVTGVDKTCRMTLTSAEGVEPVRAWSDSLFLLSRAGNISVVCPDQANTTVECDQCILSIERNCYLNSEEFQTVIEIGSLNNTTTQGHIVNLAILQKFFQEKEYG